MSTTLYYFSGTGNSYYAAAQLQKRLDGSELVPITSCLDQKEVVNTSQKIGLIFPLYFQGMPKVVTEFVQKLRLENAEYVFAVVTRGSGAYQGGALGHLKQELKAKGQQLAAGFYLSMPENYLPLLKVQSEEKQKILFQKADEKIDAISTLIDSNSKKIEYEIAGFARALSYEPFIKKLDTLCEKFKVSEKCNGCGLCEELCHFDNIKMQEGKPKWQKNCQCCLACLNYCPKQAIELGKSQNKKRYHHPSVPAREYIKLKTKRQD